MDKKILIIDESKLLRDYLKSRLEKLGFKIFLAKDGIEGLIKMRNILPDLIIMDFYLPRLNGLDFLKEKQSLKGTVNLPVVILSSKIDKSFILRLSKYKVAKIISKPIEIDSFLYTIGELFNISIDFTTSPCIIDVHLNDEILFIEVAQGFDSIKIELMRYKIMEIMSVYETKIEKILLIFTDIDESGHLDAHLDNFMDVVIEVTGIKPVGMSVLTRITTIQHYFINNPRYKFIYTTDNFTNAIENIGKIDYFSLSKNSNIDNIKTTIISSANLDIKDDENIQLKLSNEKIELPPESKQIKKHFNIAIVDDDLSILEFMETILSEENWDIRVYENGKIFVDDIDDFSPDLIFLDLFMPEMSGFDVLEKIKDSIEKIPIIVLSAMADREFIIKARRYGVKSYLTKPVKPLVIKRKAEELLFRNF